MLKKVRVEQEIYMHEYLWRSASRLLAHAETQADEAFYFLLPSLLMSFLAYEAFVNFCGFAILPELWKDEKESFKGEGIEGKIKRIVEELPGFSWRKGEVPYQGIRNLEKFRHMVAHGKVDSSQYDVERKEDGSHFRFEHPWDTYLSIEGVKKARSDIKDFCESLIVEMRKESDHLHLLHNAFEGPLASGSGVSRRG